jgi:hypothetical protein
MLFMKVLPFPILLSLIVAGKVREKQKHSCRFEKKIVLWWQLSGFLTRRDRISIQRKEGLFKMMDDFSEWT